VAVLVAASAVAWTIVVIVLIVLFLLWLYCLFDIVVVRKEHGVGWKILWCLATIVLAPIAIPVYLLFARRHATA
jgi:hypothetical protein